MEYKTTRLPIPVINRAKIMLRPSRYVVKSIPYEGIHSIVLVNVLPLAIAGIYLAKAINKRIGTVSTYHPICIRDVFLVRKGMSIAAKKGMIIAKLMVNKLKPPMFSVHAL